MRKLRISIARLLTLIAMRLSSKTVIAEYIYTLSPDDGEWHHHSFTLECWAKREPKVVGYLDGFEVVE
jgi:hypothetical protein